MKMSCERPKRHTLRDILAGNGTLFISGQDTRVADADCLDAYNYVSLLDTLNE